MFESLKTWNVLEEYRVALLFASINLSTTVFIHKRVSVINSRKLIDQMSLILISLVFLHQCYAANVHTCLVMKVTTIVNEVSYLVSCRILPKSTKK